MFIPSSYAVESVSSGHPDKMCDQISDAILDACLMHDPASRVAVETFGTGSRIFIGGEITTKTDVDYASVARKVLDEIGYVDPNLTVESHVNTQSPDIAQGVDIGGAGDQGIMYGYATSETAEMLPNPLVQAHDLLRKLEELRKTDPGFSWALPDAKTQITMHDSRISNVLISTQHSANTTQLEIKKNLTEKVIRPIVGDGNYDILINPTGKFEIGGFIGDAGLTGRKISVDTYGGLIPHGGGAFSGKDATKVDRSGAYMARYVARQLIKKGLADQALVSISYAIGKADPVMIHAQDQDGKQIPQKCLKIYDFRPRSIIDQFQLTRPIFSQTSTYGHFGKPNLPWEV